MKVIPTLTYGTECWLNVTDEQYAEMEKIFKEAMVRILSLPGNTVYDALILEMSTYHIEVWMDYLKICYFMKKIHDKKEGRLYRILREDIINEDETGFIGDVRRLCEKYELQDITLVPLTKKFIRRRCRTYSRRRSQIITLNLKKIPPMLTLEKTWTGHYDLPLFEARAITTLRTGNLAFKNWCPYKFSLKHMGDKLCLFKPCQEPDSLAHVLECEYYDTRFVESQQGPTRDWATYLVKLHDERIEKFGQPLIYCEGWSDSH